MNKKNNQLLEEVIQKRLELALKAEGEISEAAFEDAMEAIDRQIAIDRAKNEALNNQERLEEDKIKERRDSIIKCLEIGATIIAAPIITAKINKTFAHMLCDFEKNYNFTTTAGKSLSKIFKLK